LPSVTWVVWLEHLLVKAEDCCPFPQWGGVGRRMERKRQNPWVRIRAV